MYLVGYNDSSPVDLKVVEIRDDADELEIENLVNKLNLTHWVWRTDYNEILDGSVLLIYYNTGDKPKVENFSEDYRGDMQAREYAPKRGYEYVFVHEYKYNWKDKSSGYHLIDITIPNWENKDKAKSSEDAIKYIASKLSDSFNRKLSSEEIKEIEEYANKHEIPFNYDTHLIFENYFQLDYPAWDSSSKYC